MPRLAWIAATLLVAAAPTEAPAQTSVEIRAAAVPPVTDVDDGSYRLNAGDTIEIKFMQNPELNELVQIRPDGRISMPLVGELLVANTSIAELATRLSTAYADILRSPLVTIQVREFVNRRVFVGGEVNRPGVLPLTGRQTALSAVTEAGGFRPSAQRDEVLVIRRGDEDQPRVLRLSMKNTKDGRGSEASTFPLQPLDVVVVTESGIARTGRAIDQYIRQVVPFTLAATWLFGPSVISRGR